MGEVIEIFDDRPREIFARVSEKNVLVGDNTDGDN